MKENEMQISLFVAFLLSFWRPVSSSFNDVSVQVGISRVNGYLAALGDFNGDKNTDLFIVTNGGKSLEIFFWHASDQQFKKGSVTTSDQHILNVSPTDFDGDGCLDVLMVTGSGIPGSSVKAYVYWGNMKSLGEHISLSMRDQPLVMDANGDLLPDLFGQSPENSSLRYYWISKGSNRSFAEVKISDGPSSPIRIPHSNAFLDLSGDYTADLYVTNDQNKGEIWINKGGDLTEEITIPPPTSKVTDIFGQSTFADIDGDGALDLLLPVCTTDDCTESFLYVYSWTNEQWKKVLSNKGDHVAWKFIAPTHQTSSIFPLMTVRTGDFNMDGFYDGLVVLNITAPGGGQHYKQVAVPLENVPCSDEHDNCYNGRTFSVQWDVLSSLDNAVLATFFDLYENGIIGFLVVTESSPADYRIHALHNTLYTDACFLKVVVLGGRTLTSCDGHDLPYGVNQVGPFIKFTTTSSNGKVKYGSAAQLSQSAYFALQCPYTVFGLGQTPNFVDELSVGLQRSQGSPERKHTWQSIIPNSQMIIIPYPPDDPSSWIAKLLVTPSKLVLFTGVGLLGVCCFILLIILVLYLKEKREDKREKRQDAHKFHFDAM